MSNTEQEPGFWPVFGLLAALSLVPIVVSTVLPMADWPSHLAMIRILRDLGDPASPFHPFFAARPGFTPYVGFYAATGVLARVMPLEAAGRTFLCATVVAFPLSVLALVRAFGGSRWLALLAFPFAYAFPFHLGLVPYGAGIPFAIATVALAVSRMQGRRAGRAWDATAVALPLLALVMHAHAFAYALGGVAVCAATLKAPGSVRARTVAPLLPALLLFGFWSVASGLAGGGGSAGPRAEWHFSFDPLSRKLLALGPNLTDAFRDPVDAEILLAIAGMLGWAGWVALREPGRSSEDDRARGGRLTLCAALFAAGGLLGYFAMPGLIERGPLLHMLVYQRFLLPAAIGLLAIVASRAPPSPTFIWRALVATIVAANSLYLVAQFRRFDREVGNLPALLAPLAGGSCAVSMVGASPSRVLRNNLSHTHLADYATVWHGTIPGAPLAAAAHVPVALRDAAGGTVATWESASLPVLPLPTIRPLSAAQVSFYRFVVAPRGESPSALLPAGVPPLVPRGEAGVIALWENPSGTCQSR